MKTLVRIGCLVAACFLFAGCGEEYYSTPEKTLERYVNNRMMGNRQELESCLNALTREDREWFEKHYVDICFAAYGQDCPGESLSSEATVWTDFFEPAGPSSASVESSDINEDEGTAVLVVDGQEITFVKLRGNWKIQGLFGVPAQLAQRYTRLKAAL